MFANCGGLEIAVIPDRLLFPRKKLEKWQLAPDATVLRHRDLQLANQLAEYAAPDTSPERRDALRAELRAALRQAKHKPRAEEPQEG